MTEQDDTMTTQQPLAKLARVFEKTSATGNRYFVGRLGGSRLLMFLDRESDSDDPCWSLFVSPIEERQAAARNGPQRPAEQPSDRDEKPPFDDDVNTMWAG